MVIVWWQGALLFVFIGIPIAIIIGTWLGEKYIERDKK